MPKTCTISPEIERLKREARPGTCYLCDERIPGWKPPRTKREKKRVRVDWCRSKECKRLYIRIYVQDYRAAWRAEERE